ncbi:single-stranded DNA-binding protein [Pseudomonadota bacterium]
MSVNKVILIGNVGKDPEIRSMSNGREVTSFGLATTEYWKDKTTGERRDKTEWHNIVVFSPGLINIIKNYVKKGSKLYIEGTLQTRKWTDNSGAERRTTEVVLQGFNCTMQMLDSRSSGESSFNTADNSSSDNYNENSPSSSSNEKNFTSEEIDDDIPF